MAKRKYFYVIVNKENGELEDTFQYLPIYKKKKYAKDCMVMDEIPKSEFIIHKIEIEKLMDLIIKTPITK